jgi:hypothetical protein
VARFWFSSLQLLQPRHFAYGPPSVVPRRFNRFAAQSAAATLQSNLLQIPKRFGLHRWADSLAIAKEFNILVNRFVPSARSSACEMLRAGQAIFASPLRRAGWGPILEDCCGWRLGPADRIRRPSGGGRLLPLSPLALASQTPDDSPCGHAERHSLPARRACPPRCARSACARRASHSVTRAIKSAEDLDLLGFRDRLLDALCGPSGGEDPITGNGFTL